MRIFVERPDVAGRLVGLLLVALSGGCSCEDDGALASLVRVDGDVVRDTGDTLGEWADAEVGAVFVMGDGVRTSSDATATLELTGGGRLEMERSTEIRFGDAGDGAGRLEVATGAAVLEAGDDEARVLTQLGLAILEPGARVRIGAGGRHLQVMIGSAVLEEGAESRALSEGDELGEAPDEVTLPEPIEEPPARPDTPGIEIVTSGRVTRRDGEVESEIAAGTHEAVAGTQLTLARDASVTVRRGQDRVHVRGAGRVRVGGRPGGPLVEAYGGDARIEARERAVTVRVPGGTIVATVDDGPSTAEVRVRADAVSVRAVEGRVVLREDGEDEALLEQGDDARIEREAAAPAAESDGPHDIVIPAGGAVVLHDPSPPTRVRFDVTSACPAGGAVEVIGRSVRGVVHRLPGGRHRYRVRCEGGGEGEGSLRILRDSGRGRLPRSAPASIIDADGRNYTVLYQNQLPEITIRWNDAPTARSYRVRFTRGGPGGPETASRARFGFASGRFSEGRHSFVVEAGSSAAPETHVVIRYDNAAATASVHQPNDRGFSVGDQVAVEGVVVAGWSVAVDGRPLETDVSHRFSTRVTATQQAVAVRLSHPRRGVHYYLRRPRRGG